MKKITQYITVLIAVLALMLTNTNEINAQCNASVSGSDAYGDGWNGGSLEFFFDGISQGTYTVTGSGSTATITIPAGQTMTVNYTSGSWEGENEYTISIGGSPVFSDGPTPSTGMVYTYDCPGSGGGSCSVDAGSDKSICSGENVDLNGTSVGNVTISGSSTFNYSGSGQDCYNFLIGGYTSGMPSNATITSIDYDATIGYYCTSWYEIDLIINNAYISSGCNVTNAVYNGLNGSNANGQRLQLRSGDTDNWCDYVTMSASFTVNYTYSVPPTYSWSGGPIISGSNTLTPTVNPTSTTTYTLTATGCSASDEVEVVVNPLPTVNAGTALAAICQGATSIAMGGSVGGTATGGTWSGGAGSWNNASNPATATYTAGASETGTVTLTLTTSGGSCGTTSDTKTITINENPTVDVGSALSAICQGATSNTMGGSVGGGATGGTWSGGAGSWTNANDPDNATYTAGANESGTVTLTLITTGGSCGTTSDTKTVVVITPPGNPAVFGDQVWNVYGYNGNNTNVSTNNYKGYYIQPNLGGGNLGVKTQDFWTVTKSLSSAGTPIDNGNLWSGCPVNVDNNTFVHKRKGFPCGNYTFSMNEWDGETRVIIDGVDVWSCGVRDENNLGYINSNSSATSCLLTTSLAVQLDADSEIEIQTFEAAGNAKLGVDIIKVSPSALGGTIPGGTFPSTRTCVTKGSSWINFLDDNDKLIASINPNGEDLGKVTVTSYVGLPDFMKGCILPGNTLYHTAYMKRTWVMTSDAYPSGTDFNNNVSVRLPYKSSELSNLNSYAQTATTGNPTDGGTTNPATRANLMLTKITGTTENGIANLADCASTIRGVTSSGSGTNMLSTTDTEYVDFSIGQFSEFFTHKGNDNSNLPVTLTNFSASCDKQVTLNWTTASEQNSDYFMVEKSRTGQEWIFVGEQEAAGNSTTTINYNELDQNATNGVTYYRLRQVDMNGDEEMYGPISVSCSNNKNSLTAFPNPNNGSFTIEVSSDEMHSDAHLLLTDMTGKVITFQNVDVSVGTTQVMMDNLNLPKGAYLVSLQGSGMHLRPIKVIVD